MKNLKNLITSLEQFIQECDSQPCEPVYLCMPLRLNRRFYNWKDIFTADMFVPISANANDELLNFTSSKSTVLKSFFESSEVLAGLPSHSAYVLEHLRLCMRLDCVANLQPFVGNSVFKGYENVKNVLITSDYKGVNWSDVYFRLGQRWVSLASPQARDILVEISNFFILPFADTHNIAVEANNNIKLFSKMMAA